MQEARIILPLSDNDGEALETVHDSLTEKLADIFGGFTRHNGIGGWRSPNGAMYREAVALYDVACEPSLDNLFKLRQLAQWLKGAARQQAIYLRMPTGHVEFV